MGPNECPHQWPQCLLITKQTGLLRSGHRLPQLHTEELRPSPTPFFLREITIFTIQFLCHPNCVCSRAYIGTPGLFGMLCVFSVPINTRDCGNALCSQFFKMEKMANNCDDGDFDLPSITSKQESTCSSEISRDCLVWMQGTTRWIEISFCVSFSRRDSPRWWI